MDAILEQGADHCLFAGLDALCRGDGALLAGLRVVHRQVGARYTVWAGLPSSSGGYALCDAQGARRVDELPDHLPVGWMEESADRGPLRLMGPDSTGRDPRARALSIDWILVARSRKTGGGIWMGGPTPLNLGESWSASLVRALDVLEQMDGQRLGDQQLQRMADMGERAAGVAHDLRNQLSLTKLEFDSSIMRAGIGLPRADAALGQALELCRQFMAEETPLSSAPRLLQPHLRAQIEESVRLSGRQGEVRVALRCPGDLTAIFDPQLLTRFLRNLLLNALQATPRGGAVRIAARAGVSGHVELEIADEGRGMEQAALERLLRAGETQGGTGFGTSSILGCAQQMAADLDVESKPAAGTRFCLTLPAGQGER